MHPSITLSVTLLITCLSAISPASAQVEDAAPEPPLIPRPATIRMEEGRFTLDQNMIIQAGPGTEAVGWFLASRLYAATKMMLPVLEDPQEIAHPGIVLRFERKHIRLGPEGYRLTITPQQVHISSSGPAGVFYGMQTLLQLMPPEIYRKGHGAKADWSSPCLVIEDRPRFAWRGAMLDVSRHFMPLKFLMRFVDTLSVHKMNRFHLHLSDDQGWRMEIKKYPKLTEVGAWREETLKGHYRDKPHRYDGVRHGGFYTQNELKSLVAYAAARHVTIVPEIEMPGHAQAAIAAYPELGNTGKPLPVRTIWGVNRNIFNAEEETILFLEDVLTEVLEVFPGPFIHIGGDEAPKDQWKASEKAQARIAALGLKDEDELQSWFIRRMDAFLVERGRRLIGWDEILEGGLAPNATVMSWRGNQGGITAARAGHDVVMAPTHSTYFDYYQAPAEREPLAIGGFLPLEKVYTFDPIPAELSDEEAKHILGTQGQLWTEYIKTPAQAEYMGVPAALRPGRSGLDSEGGSALRCIPAPPRDAPEATGRAGRELPSPRSYEEGGCLDTGRNERVLAGDDLGSYAPSRRPRRLRYRIPLSRRRPSAGHRLGGNPRKRHGEGPGRARGHHGRA